LQSKGVHEDHLKVDRGEGFQKRSTGNKLSLLFTPDENELVIGFVSILIGLFFFAPIYEVPQDSTINLTFIGLVGFILYGLRYSYSSFTQFIQSERKVVELDKPLPVVKPEIRLIGITISIILIIIGVMASDVNIRVY